MRKVVWFGSRRTSVLRVPFRPSIAATILPLCLIVASLCAPPPASADLPFTPLVVDPGSTPWGKNLADVDGDGFLDALEGGGYSLGQTVKWCRYPTWTQYTIGTSGGGDDLQVADIDNDGAVDVVVNGGPTVWYENPRGNGGNPQGLWTAHVIDGNTLSHDLDIADINGDGKRDVLSRVAGGPTYVYLQNNSDSWTRIDLTQAETAHQGAAFADINSDGRVDVLGNGYWLEQPTNPVTGTWTKRVIGAFSSCSIAYGDLNGDGRKDVTFATSEVGTGTMTWFEAPTNPTTGTWIRHDIATATDVHRHHLIDMDRDGDRDIVFAEMHQSSTDRVGIFWNKGGGVFTIQVLSTSGSHNIAVGDLEHDGDTDIVGANWNTDAPDGGGLRLWRNDATLTGVPEDTPPAASRVVSLGNWPNPFRVETAIQFQVDGTLPAGAWKLRVFDTHGRLVRTVWPSPTTRQFAVSWDGRMDTGRRAPAGVYYYRLDSGDLISTGRMVLGR